MPLQRLAFQEVASRFSQQAISHNPATYQVSGHIGDEAALSSSGSVSTANGPTHGQPTLRQPSRRPIDRRWDKSRGIVLNRRKRNAIRDYSWSPTHNIIFSSCEAPSIQHMYSTKATPTPPRRPNFGVSAPGGSTAAKPTARATMGPPKDTRPERLSGGSLEREQEYFDGQKAIRELGVVKAELDTTKRQLDTVKEAKRSIERESESSQKTHDYRIKGKEEEITLKVEEITRIQREREEYAKKQVEEAILETRKVEQEKADRNVKAVRQEMADALNHAKNRPVAAEEKAKAEKEKARAEMRRASLAMNALEEAKARANTLEQEIEELSSQSAADMLTLRTETERTNRSLTATYDRELKIAANEAAARPLKRNTYGEYKAVYEELRHELSGLNRAFRDAKDGYNAQMAYWKTAQGNFETFCEDQSKSWLVSQYPKLVDRIGKLPEASMKRAKDANSEVEELRSNVEEANDVFQWAAHDHRLSARNLRFHNPGDYGDASRIAHTLGHIDPWSGISDLATREASESLYKKAIRVYFRAQDPLLRHWSLLKKLEAIRADDIGAKAVFLETDHHRIIYNRVANIRAVVLAQYDKTRGRPLPKNVSGAIEVVDKALERSKDDSILYADKLRREAMIKQSLDPADEVEKRYNAQLDSAIREKKREICHVALALASKKSMSKPVAVLNHASNSRRQRQVAAKPLPRIARSKKMHPGYVAFKPTPAPQASHIMTLPGVFLPKPQEVTVNMALLPDDARRSPFGRLPLHPLTDTRPFTAVANPSTLPLAYEANQAHPSHQSTAIAPVANNPSAQQPAKPESNSDVGDMETTAESAGHTEMASVEQHQTLSYQIPAEDFKSAITASENTTAAYWKHTLYKGPEGQAPRYHYCTSLETAETQAKQFLDEPVLGFDIEWETWAKLDGSSSSSIKDNVSLIQIAAEDKIGLFHVARFKGNSADELMPPSLRHILESPYIIKAGVNVVGDATRLRKCLNTEMQGLFELSHLYKVVMFSENESHKVNRVPFSLAKQVQAVLHLPLKKGEVRTSSWSKRLNLEQCLYAASDAYAGFRLFDALEAKRKLMRPTPPRPAYYELHQPLLLGNGKKVMPRPRGSKHTSAGKSVEPNDEEDEEFFDAVETQEDHAERHSSPGVPLSGITYPTLPLFENLSINESASHANAAASVGGNGNNSGNGARSILPSSLASKLPTTSTPRAPIPYTPEAAAAEAWATVYRAEPNNSGTTPANLRAYHLWHYQEKSVIEIAAMLRETPLSNQTVASYIMQALKEAKLPCRVERTREVIEVLPSSVRWRYNAVLRRLEEESDGS